MSRLQRQLSRLSGLGPPARSAPAVPVPAAAPVPESGSASEGVPTLEGVQLSAVVSLPVTGEASAARIAALRARLAAYRGRRRVRAMAAEALPTGELPGAWEETAAGGMHVLRVAHEAAYAHGMAPLAHSLRATGAHMAALGLDDGLLQVTSPELLYLDTETTGLAGGAGTLPFLIGTGRFVAGCWQMEQLFLRRPGEEAPMLHHLAERMRQASAIVTYNGKSFDWPLLRTRFVLNRVPLPPPLPHLDLLHCARRLLPQLSGGARLCHVERSLLAFERVDDVDGALIPQLYFEFLRGGPAAPMAAVMQHNAYDLAALAAMLGVFATRLEASPVATVSSHECLAMARLYERRGDMVQAHAWAQRAAGDGDAGDGGAGEGSAAASRSASGTVVGEAHALRARLHLRAGAFADAATAWGQALAGLGGHVVLAAQVRLALAKLYEHRLKDGAAALAHAAHTSPVEGVEAMRRRIARLQGKVGRSSSDAPGLVDDTGLP